MGCIRAVQALLAGREEVEERGSPSYVSVSISGGNRE